MLSLRDVSCRAAGSAGSAGSAALLLEKISFALDAGDILALFGPSGGGKSSLLRLLVRFLDPSAGEIVFAGRPLAAWDPRELRCRIGLVRQQAHMFPGTVLDNLQQAFRWQKRTPPEPDSEQLRAVLDRCQLDSSLLVRPASQLSIGQQQRVALARTLLLEPELLLLDEPTSALDRPTADQIGATLLRLKGEGRMGMLLVSHDLRQLERLADRGLFLADGRLVEQGEMEQLLRRPRTERLRDFLQQAEADDGG